MLNLIYALLILKLFSMPNKIGDLHYDYYLKKLLW
jgi:hypothetical protein